MKPSEVYAPSTRLAGIAGVLGGALFIAMLMWEYAADLQPNMGPMEGHRLVNQVVFFIAMSGYVMMLLGLHRARVTGPGLFGRISTGIFTAGWILLVICSGLTAVGVDQDQNFLLPLAALLVMAGGLMAGIAVVRAGVWTGWRRWILFAVAIYYVFLVFSPVGMITEIIWALSYIGLGIALSTPWRQPTPHRPLAAI